MLSIEDIAQKTPEEIHFLFSEKEKIIASKEKLIAQTELKKSAKYAVMMQKPFIRFVKRKRSLC